MTPAKPRTLQATMTVPIGITGNVELWLKNVMEKLAAEGGLRINRTQQEDGLHLREWRPIMDADGSWTQQVLIQLADEGELRRLHKTLQGRNVSVGGFQAPINIESLYVDLQANRQGKAGSL